MNCSYTSRCDNPKLIYFDDIYICDNCFSIFEKHHKELNKQIIFKCCNNQNIIYSYNKPICDNCYTMCVINIKNCCKNSNIMRYNCYKLYKPSIANSRLKYLRKNFNHLDNNIILFLDESLKKIQTYKNLKKISIIIYVNSIYKFYTQKANIEYKKLNDKKLIKFDDNILKILNQVYDKYPYFHIEDEFDRMFL